MTTSLAVIGNISIDTVHYPIGITHAFVGGAGLHVSLAAAHAEVPVALVAVVGSDLAGVKDTLTTRGVDLTWLRIADGPTCRFDMTYDNNGALVDVDSRFGVAEELTDHALASVGAAHNYHLSCRRPVDPARLLPDLPLDRTSVDFFGPSASGMMRAVRVSLPGFAAIFVNAIEHRTLSALIDVNSLPCLIVTDGPRRTVVSRYGQSVAAATPPTRHVADVTGAGDTLCGTFLACRHKGCSDQQALDRAVEAAADAVATIGLSELTVPADTSDEA